MLAADRDSPGRPPCPRRSTPASPSSASPCPRRPRRRPTTSPSSSRATRSTSPARSAAAPDGLIIGKLGAGVSVEDGAAAAATCAHQLIAQLKAACGGDLDRVKRVVKLTGFVNSAPDFTDQPKVVNGCSDVFVAVFGDAGRHARSAVGVAALPLGVAVEVEGVFEIA